MLIKGQSSLVLHKKHCGLNILMNTQNIKNICCGYSLELSCLAESILINIQNIFYVEVYNNIQLRITLKDLLALDILQRFFPQVNTK